MRLQGWLPVALIALVLAGCGGDEEGGGGSAAGSGADPSQVMPADAPFYFEAVVRPEGEQGDNAEALIGRFLKDKTITDLLDEQLAKEDKSYAEDIEPWLGSSAGAAAFDLTADEPSFVVAVSVTDAEAAETAISSSEDTKEGPKVGDIQTYQSDDDAFGAVTSDFLLVTDSQATLESALETADGEGLGDSERFTSAIDELPEERLGSFYMDMQAVKELAAQDPTLDAAGKQVLDQFLGEGEPVTGALVAEEDALRGEFRVSTSAFGPLGSLFSAEAPELVGEMPAGSWMTFGYQDVGNTVKTLVEQFAGVLGGAAVTGQFEQQTGLNLERDVYSWLGDMALFVGGDSLASLESGLVIEATDEGAAKAAIPRIVQALRRNGAPVREANVEGAELAYTGPSVGIGEPLVVAYGNGRAVVAIGEQAALDGLDASDPLKDSEVYDSAQEAIDGVAPSFLIDYSGIVALAESAGTVDDPEYQEIRPYLEQLDVIVSGAEEDGDELRSLFAIKVK